MICFWYLCYLSPFRTAWSADSHGHPTVCSHCCQRALCTNHLHWTHQHFNPCVHYLQVKGQVSFDKGERCCASGGEWKILSILLSSCFFFFSFLIIISLCSLQIPVFFLSLLFPHTKHASCAGSIYMATSVLIRCSPSVIPHKLTH